jgi:RNA polymerase sigma-70 factor, ECF subfamily
MIHGLLKRLFDKETQSGMVSEGAHELTELLSNFQADKPEDWSRATSLLYPDLRRIAESRMRRERANHTLQPTALVNECYLQLAKQRKVSPKNRAHFLAVAARVMRNILVDYARSHNAEKRNGGVSHVTLVEDHAEASSDPLDMLAFDEVLARLAARDPRMARVAEMRLIGGLTHAEIGRILGIDERTVKRDFKFARTWLYTELQGKQPDVGGAMGSD